MRIQVWIGAAALAGTAALGALSLLLRPEQTSGAQRRVAPAAEGGGEVQLAAVKGEVASLRAELAALKQRAAEPKAEPPEEQPEPTEVEPTPARRGVTPEAAQAHFDALLEHEPLERGWAGAQEASISEFVKHEGGDGTVLESVECRSTLCRLKLRFADGQTRDAFKLKLGMPPLNDGGFYRDQGETGLAYFAARKGHPLPAVPEDS
jgi:hypothetical protein